MSITTRMLARAVTGEPRCHFLVQWRDSHAEQHGRTFATFDEAAAFDAAIKAGRLPRDSPGRRTAVTFGTAAARWLATKQATKRPSTADLYATELRSHVLPAFASMPLPDITRRDVQEWVNALAASGLAPATVRHAYRAVFKSVLNDAIDDGLLASSPCHRIELPAAPLPVIEPLTPAQILTLANRIDRGTGRWCGWPPGAGCAGQRPPASPPTDSTSAAGPRSPSTGSSPTGPPPPAAGAMSAHLRCSRRRRPAPRAGSSRCPPPWPRRCANTCAAARPARPGCCSPPPRERAQPGELAVAHLAAPGPVRAWHPGRDHLPPPPPCLCLAARRCGRARPRHPAAARPRPPRRDPLVPSPLPRPGRRPGDPRRHRHRSDGSRIRPRAGGCVLILLTEKLTSPKPGGGQRARYRRSHGMYGCAARDLNPEPAD